MYPSCPMVKYLMYPMLYVICDMLWLCHSTLGTCKSKPKLYICYLWFGFT